jgi:hypothetical protein
VITAAYDVPKATNGDAWAALQSFLALPQVDVIDEPPELGRHWCQLGAIEQAAPKRWLDAYLAAFAIASGLPLSGVEWLGEVPEHWEVLPCRAIVDERTEKNEGAARLDYLSLMVNIGVIPYEEKGNIGNKQPEDLRQLLLQRGEAHLLGEAGRDAVAGEGLDLGRRIGAVAELLDPGQVLVVAPFSPVRTPGLKKARSMAQLEEKHIRRA